MIHNTRINKKDMAILITTLLLLSGIVIFCVMNWHLVISLFELIVEGKEIVRGYGQCFGIIGAVAIGVLIIFCFFFPVISSLPLQILALMAYGLWPGTLLISCALALASQLLFLMQKNIKRFFYSKKQLQKQAEIEQCIKNSSRSIDGIMILLYIVPCIPFLVISSLACRSNMKWWKYTLYTALGPIPEIIVTLMVGNQITKSTTPVMSTIILLFMILLVILCLVYQDRLIYYLFEPKKEKRTHDKSSI